MKKLLLLGLCGAVIFTFSFLLIPDFHTFVYSRLAAVIGIDIREVRRWQRQGGLNRDLAFGDTGGDVRLLQEGLNKILSDFPATSITGYYGPKTAKAVSDFQITQGLPVSGRLDADTRSAVNEIYFKELCPSESNVIYPDEILIRVNRDKALPADYIPHNLIPIPDSVKTIGTICLKQDVMPFLEKMFTAAANQNVRLVVTSGFRRPEMQSIIQKIWRSIEGKKSKDGVAEALHSEHQLGTTIDISGESIDFIGADDTFDGTTEDAWLKQNSYKYGFVMSYTKDKTAVTGYRYEPWHYRFVGVYVAKQIFEKQISVEEYFNSLHGILNF